jgi:hypothetical protein
MRARTPALSAYMALVSAAIRIAEQMRARTPALPAYMALVSAAIWIAKANAGEDARALSKSRLVLADSSAAANEVSIPTRRDSVGSA